VPISRDAFLQRVRDAVQAGNRPGCTAPIEPRGDAGYQGAGPDPVARFRDELLAAGGQAYLVPDDTAAVAQVQQLVHDKAARKVLLGHGAVLDRLGFETRLRTQALAVTTMGELPPERSRETFFDADLGISGADFLIAETGSIVVRARPDEPRSLSLLPPIHIVVADRGQLLPDLFDLFAALPPDLPSGLAVITGPSKTGDIELRLVTGVHGPGEVHVVLING
jgi:L-lactate utilization protein LutC